jgi:hypothetical protein
MVRSASPSSPERSTAIFSSDTKYIFHLNRKFGLKKDWRKISRGIGGRENQFPPFEKRDKNHRLFFDSGVENRQLPGFGKTGRGKADQRSIRVPSRFGDLEKRGGAE